MAGRLGIKNFAEMHFIFLIKQRWEVLCNFGKRRFLKISYEPSGEDDHC